MWDFVRMVRSYPATGGSRREASSALFDREADGWSLPSSDLLGASAPASFFLSGRSMATSVEPISKAKVFTKCSTQHEKAWSVVILAPSE